MGNELVARFFSKPAGFVRAKLRLHPLSPACSSPRTVTSSVDLELPEGLLVGLGHAATGSDSPLDFRQAQSAAERSGVAGPHYWSLMLPTSARVSQEVYEPLITKGSGYAA